jgi:hypothetical protein
MNIIKLLSILIVSLALLTVSRAGVPPYSKLAIKNSKINPALLLSIYLLQNPTISIAASSAKSFESRLDTVESKVDLLTTQVSSLTPQVSSLTSQVSSLTSQFSFFQTTLFIVLPLLIYISQENMMSKLEKDKKADKLATEAVRKADKLAMETARKADKEDMNRNMIYNQSLTIFVLVLSSSFTTGSPINTFFVNLLK